MSEKASDSLAGCIYPLSLCLMAAGPLVLAYQCYLWLKRGEWTPISAADGLAIMKASPPSFEWAGVQRISDGFFNLPLAAVLFFGGLLLAVAFSEIADRLSRKRQTTKH